MPKEKPQKEKEKKAKKIKAGKKSKVYSPYYRRHKIIFNNLVSKVIASVYYGGDFIGKVVGETEKEALRKAKYYIDTTQKERLTKLNS